MILFILVTLFSYATYFHTYNAPQAFYWDENYYVTDAQKHLNNVFYMQIHPPLGKMLIAWGESLLNASTQNDQYLDTEHAKEFPGGGFSLTGYRFFPALLSWLTAPVFFAIVLLLTGKPFPAFFLSFLYIFDNALIVHNRGAMLDGPALAFFLLTTLLFLLAYRYKQRRIAFLVLSFALGVSVALTFLVKYQGLIVILFVPALLWLLFPHWKRMLVLFSLSAAGFLLTFTGIWYLHFAQLTVINPALNNNGYYNASDAYRRVLDEGEQRSIRHFPLMLRDTLAYVPKYNSGIPKLNMCKPDENGSPWYFWPFGIKSIGYRWNTPDGTRYQYMYLQANPVVWAIGLTGLILAVAYVFATTLLSLPRSRHHRMILIFLGIYVAYMAAMARIDRVLFLYTYFPLLVLSFILFALLFDDIRAIGSVKMTEARKFLIAGGIGTIIVLSFLFYSPLTYYKLLTNEQFAKRDLISLWDLRCAQCERKKTLCFPIQ